MRKGCYLAKIFEEQIKNLFFDFIYNLYVVYISFLSESISSLSESIRLDTKGI